MKQQILNDNALRPTITRSYCSGTPRAQDPNDPKTPIMMHYGTQEEYFSGLGWQLIGAHVPGLLGGYFGHWCYRPDNEPKEADDEA